MPSIISLLMVAILIGVLSYLFGFWDKDPHKAEVSLGVICLISAASYIILTGFLYITFAFWHKLLGPYF